MFLPPPPFTHAMRCSGWGLGGRGTGAELSLRPEGQNATPTLPVPVETMAQIDGRQMRDRVVRQGCKAGMLLTIRSPHQSRSPCPQGCCAPCTPSPSTMRSHAPARRDPFAGSSKAAKRAKIVRGAVPTSQFAQTVPRMTF